MAAYAEGLNILRNADAGKRKRDADAETAPMRNPEFYQYDAGPARDRGSLAPRQRDRLVAAGSHRRRAARRSRSLKDSRAACRIRAKGRWTLAAADRRRRAGAGAQRRAVRALRVARRSRLRRPGALRHAQAVRRARREEDGRELRWPDRCRSAAPLRCAGAVRRDGRPRPQDDLPGALRDGQAGRPRGPGGRRRLPEVEPGAAARARRRTASARRAGSTTPRRCSRLLSLLRYVSGDYNDPATFAALKQALGAARRPAHYLAIPPSLFAHGHRGARRRGPGRTARASSSRSRSAATWLPRASSTSVARAVFPEDSIFRIDHFLGEGSDHEHPLLPLRQLVPRADLEPQLRGQRADHAGRGFRRRTAAARSTKRPAACAM